MKYKSVILHLKEEHEKILLVLGQGEELQRRFEGDDKILEEQLEDLLFFFREFADKLHHRKEEDILFPQLETLPQLPGGPHCTYYSGLRLMREPIDEEVKQINRSLGLEESDEIPQIKEGNPLNPIFEEHLLGRKLVQAMKVDLRNYEEDRQKKHLADFFRRFSRYNSLLREHITKENDCLFYMVDQCLSSETQSKILQDLEAVDQLIDENKLSRFKKMLNSPRLS